MPYGNRAPSVLVTTTIEAPTGERIACGSVSHARAVADVFEAGILTITSVDDDSEIASYAAGMWVEAIVYDMNLEFHYVLLPHHSPKEERKSA